MNLTTDAFIQRAVSVHGTDYDYSKVIYNNYKSKIIIICKIHGEFLQSPAIHLSGSGCMLCSYDRLRSQQSEFINKAILQHGNKYNYDLVKYINARTDVTIKCNIHGEFQQKPYIHLDGCGCQKCYDDGNINSADKFIAKSKTIHGNLYDYCFVDYVNNTTIVTILCRTHGKFRQRPANHLKGAGCQQCAKESCLLSQHEFIQKAYDVHGDEYDYSRVVYLGAFNCVDIICYKHGVFKQTPANHIQGSRCPDCVHDQSRLPLDKFVGKANTVHNNKYDYAKVTYKSAFDKITIICPEHGEFKQRRINHINGAGCPACHVSSGHRKILSLIPPGVTVINNDRTLIYPYEIDVLLPDNMVGIEFHGNYWHSDNNWHSNDKTRHLKKHELSIKAGIKLLQFFEYELHKSDIIKSMINHAVGRSQKIYARKCAVNIIDNATASIFFDGNHIAGHRVAKLYYCLKNNNQIVSVLSVTKYSRYWEIIRFANLCGITVIGGFSKLLKSFIRDIDPHTIITYADKRFGDGQVYHLNGFTKIGSTNPNYKYINLNTGDILSRQQCQKHKLHKLLSCYDENKSESRNMIDNGYGRIWDAGHYKFEMVRNGNIISS